MLPPAPPAPADARTRRRCARTGVRDAGASSSRWVAVVALLAVAAAVAAWLDGRRDASAICAMKSPSGSPPSRRRRRRPARRKPTSRPSCATRRRAPRCSRRGSRESQAQQAALEALYRDLAPSRDEIALSEIEQVLLVASQQLQLAGNVPSALTALQLADAKLQRLDRPQFVPLRRALSREMDQLKAVPFVDVTGLGLKLDQAIAGVGTLPLAMDERLPPPVADAAPPADEPRVAAVPARCVGRHEAARADRIVRSTRGAAAPAVAAVFPARESAPAAPVGAHRARQPRRRELQGRHRGVGGVGRPVFRHAHEARAGAAGDAEADRRDAARRRDARPLAQPRSAARAAALAGPHARARPPARRPRADVRVRILFWFLLLAAAAVGGRARRESRQRLRAVRRAAVSRRAVAQSAAAAPVARLRRPAMRCCDSRCARRRCRAKFARMRRRQQEARARAKLDAAVVALLEGRYGKARQFAEESARHSRRARDSPRWSRRARRSTRATSRRPKLTSPDQLRRRQASPCRGSCSMPR